MIEIKGLSKTFKTANGSLLALDNVNLRLEAGEMVGIIGMSGAGKTTLLRCLSLLEKPDEGVITIDGLNLLEARDDRMRDYRQKIGVVFQGNQLLKQRNVYENIAFPLTLKGEAKQNYDERIKRLIELVGLQGKEGSYPSQLSGGQKQRVAIARSLINDPLIIMGDEPTGNLDSRNSGIVFDIFKSISAHHEQSLLVVTHDNDFASRTDRIIEMDDGKVIG